MSIFFFQSNILSGTLSYQFMFLF